MPRELTVEDMEELARASSIGIFELLPVDQVDAAIARTEVSAVRVLVRLRSMPELAVGRFIVLEVIEAPRVVGVCRECGCGDNRACPPAGCYWVEPDLCSACAPRAHPNLKPEDCRQSPILTPSVDDVRLLAKT